MSRFEMKLDNSYTYVLGYSGDFCELVLLFISSSIEDIKRSSNEINILINKMSF